MKNKTAIKKILSNLENSENIELIKLLEKALIVEREQIQNAFDEGMKFGMDKMRPPVDYPASRYFVFTFEGNF